MTHRLSRKELDAKERQLASAMAEFEHQLRRISDRLECSGGRSFALETELKQLNEILDLTRHDLEQIRSLRKSSRDDAD